jgi:hypothetical protein
MRMLFGLLLGIIIGAAGMLWFYAHGGRIIFAGRELGSPLRATSASYASDEVTCDSNEKCLRPRLGTELTEAPNRLGTSRPANPTKDGKNFGSGSSPAIFGPNSPPTNSGSDLSQSVGFGILPSQGFGLLGGSNGVSDVASPSGTSWPSQTSGFSPSQKRQN